MNDKPKKSLGQHWLHDEPSLRAMVEVAEVGPEDTVLEIGPGLGTLTQKLVTTAAKVVAVEFDPDLARDLSSRVAAPNLEVIHHDILHFDLTSLPANYKVAANVPYYITTKLLRLLLESPNSPSVVALLVQKEVAQRMAAEPGDMSILAVATQFYAQAQLHEVVPAKLFTPPPKVDSQIIKLTRRQTPLFPDIESKDYFKVVRAGFAEKRKKLRSSLSGGLHLSKQEVDELLAIAGIAAEARAQELGLEDWYRLAKAAKKREAGAHKNNCDILGRRLASLRNDVRHDVIHHQSKKKQQGKSQADQQHSPTNQPCDNKFRTCLPGHLGYPGVVACSGGICTWVCPSTQSCRKSCERSSGNERQRHAATAATHCDCE